MADLATTASVKEHLQIASGTTTWDAILATLITRASAVIAKHCERTFESTLYTEYYDGGVDSLVLKQFPLTSVTSINDDPLRTFSTNSLIDPTTYYVDEARGMIRFIGYATSGSPGSLRVIYTAGYSSVPADIAFACVLLVAFYFNRRKSEGRSSEGMGGISVGHATEWPQDVHRILEKYRRYMESL